ncbi:MAG TPA: hypothetical protein VJR89_39055 [Polyangiales bacterium]|nr:hypothetical protein [Polyangiales bacterium]
MLESLWLEVSAFGSGRLDDRSGRSEGLAGGRTDFFELLPCAALWEAELFAGGIEDRLGLACFPAPVCARLFFGGGALEAREDRGVLFVGIFTS